MSNPLPSWSVTSVVTQMCLHVPELPRANNPDAIVGVDAANAVPKISLQGRTAHDARHAEVSGRSVAPHCRVQGLGRKRRRGRQIARKSGRAPRRYVGPVLRMDRESLQPSGLRCGPVDLVFDYPKNRQGCPNLARPSSRTLCSCRVPACRSRRARRAPPARAACSSARSSRPAAEPGWPR